ncbi:MAG: choice-of-anchor tandem repeat GloVer-containing protein [Candidatus Cybelea sp.]
MKHLRIHAFTVLFGALLAGCGNNGLQSPTSAVRLAGKPPVAAQQVVPRKLAAASSEKVLYRFKGGMDGSDPVALIYINGRLFGTTAGGGGSYCFYEQYGFGCGTIYSIDTSGSGYTLLHRYPDSGTGGARPSTLTYSNGQLYGTTGSGGNLSCGEGFGCGTVFTMDPSGASYNVLYSFASLQDGRFPVGALPDLNGALYGVTEQGGSGKCDFTAGLVGCGTLYKVNVSSGEKRTLYNFQGGKDGYLAGGLIDLHGMLYGTTITGGVSNCASIFLPYQGCGTIFKIRPSGEGYRVIYRFKGPIGSGNPNNVLDVNGTLYGSTANAACEPSGLPGCGTLFKFDIASHRLTVLYRFRGGNDGSNPNSLLAYMNGELYSTTVNGGDTSCQSYYGIGCGTVFKFDLASGRETVLHRFKGGRDGANPRSGVIEVNGALYGTTVRGGRKNNGIVFSLSP